jgi:hypothetical protein
MPKIMSGRYSENGGHLQRLAWDIVIFPSYIRHYSQSFNKSYPVFFGVWDGSDDTFGNENPIVESIDRF